MVIARGPAHYVHSCHRRRRGSSARL